MKKYMGTIDILLLFLLPALAVFLSLKFNLNLLLGTLLFFGVPAVYLGVRRSYGFKKALLFTSLFFVPFTLIVDHIGVLDGSWLVPQTIFPFRLLGTVPLEDFFISFTTMMFVVLFYQHFLDRERRRLFYPRLHTLVVILLSCLALFFTVFLLSPSSLSIPYAYVYIGFLGIVPTACFLYKHPNFFKKFAIVGLYFFLVLLFFELVGIELGWWVFPGTNFLGWVHILQYKFPLEEFILWIGLFPVGIVTYYEFFDDDEK